MKKLVVFLFVLYSLPLFSQGPGAAYNPETANGASNISYLYYPLKWKNPDAILYNEVYLSYDSSKVSNLDPAVKCISGYPSTVYDSIYVNQQLYYPTRYFWCVVEYDSTGFTKGEVWCFYTTQQQIDFIQFDDFSFGTGKWILDNNGNCGWKISNSLNYNLPIPSTGNVLTADAYQCGNPINATAEFQQTNSMQDMYMAKLEFESDWKTENINDYAKVEMKINEGLFWTTIWEKNGISDRNKHVDFWLFENNWFGDTIYNVQIRFSTYQNGVNSWWAIDNVRIIGADGILTHVHPYITYSKTILENPPKVFLKWGQIIPVPNEKLDRKVGIPTSSNSYETIAYFSASYYSTFIDSTVNESTIYTYRVGNNEWGNWYVYSNEITVYVPAIVPVELTSFTSSINENNVRLSWQTATETNNAGFEIQREQVFSPQSSVGNERWKVISFINGNGTTTEPQSYSFVDKNLEAGKYQYRLKQIDFDGTFEYSDIIEAEINPPAKFSLEQNYPNPFNPSTKIHFTIPTSPLNPSPYQGEGNRERFVTLKVFDVLGKEVATLVNEEKPAGKYEIEFNSVETLHATSLPSGVYFYQLRAGDPSTGSGQVFIETKKMILLR
ncbi:MAG TPA: hypothetical protein DHV28_01860 [Ignavibacteriales bacterium]|nr:hypothetical protein [Ignavibacteriales bacterium]